MKSRFLLFLFLLSSSFCMIIAEPASRKDSSTLQGFHGQLKDAFSRYDVEAMKGLFLPPDASPEGTRRAEHLKEMEKDWTKARAAGNSNMSITASRVILRAKVQYKENGVERDGDTMEFTLTSTPSGWRIARLETVQPSSETPAALPDVKQAAAISQGGDTTSVKSRLILCLRALNEFLISDQVRTLSGEEKKNLLRREFDSIASRFEFTADEFKKSRLDYEDDPEVLPLLKSMEESLQDESSR